MSRDSLRQALSQNAEDIERALELQQYDALQRHVRQRGELLRAWCKGAQPPVQIVEQQQAVQKELIGRVLDARDAMAERVSEGRRRRRASRAYRRASGM